MREPDVRRKYLRLWSPRTVALIVGPLAPIDMPPSRNARPRPVAEICPGYLSLPLFQYTVLQQ